MSIWHSRVGTKFRLKMNLEFLDLKGISKLKERKLPSNSTYSN